jgi:hypothetical protein
MDEKIHGTPADMALNDIMIHRGYDPDNGYFPHRVTAKNGVMEIEGRIANELKKEIRKDICLTPEQYRGLGYKLDGSAEKVYQTQSLPSIISAGINTIRLMLLKKGALSSLISNGRNLFKNKTLGEDFMTEIETNQGKL